MWKCLEAMCHIVAGYFIGYLFGVAVSLGIMLGAVYLFA